VEEAFVARRAAKRLLVVPARRDALERLVLHATSLRIPVVEVEGGTLTAVAGFDGHQGIALVVEPRAFATPDDVLARAVERGEPPFVLVMDSLVDPQNVGTLLRSAEAAGVHGVIFPTRRQAPLSPAAIKASAGAVEHLLLAPVDDLPGALSDLRMRGLRVAAAEADAPLTAGQADLRGPLAIVVGSEGQGLSPAVRRRADLAIRIPMRGAIGSLNAAVAGSILLFTAVEQRGGEVPPPPVRPGDASTDDVQRAAEAPEAEAATENVPAPPAEPEKRTRPRKVNVDAAPEPAEPARRTRQRKASADAAPEPAEPVKPRRARKAAAEAAPEAEPVKPTRARKAKPQSEPAASAPDPADAEPDGQPDELLPGPATPATTRSRRTRKAATTDPDIA
jgi:23S rRNA (guanosine2251-2'-O)-methyltransferase